MSQHYTISLDRPEVKHKTALSRPVFIGNRRASRWGKTRCLSLEIRVSGGYPPDPGGSKDRRKERDHGQYSPVAVGLWLAGVPMVFLLGVIAAALEFLSFIGPIASAIRGILIAFTQGWTTALYALVVYIIVQQVENHLLIPLIQRKAVEVPPALVILAVAATYPKQDMEYHEFVCANRRERTILVQCVAKAMGLPQVTYSGIRRSPNQRCEKPLPLHLRAARHDGTDRTCYKRPMSWPGEPPKRRGPCHRRASSGRSCCTGAYRPDRRRQSRRGHPPCSH